MVRTKKHGYYSHGSLQFYCSKTMVNFHKGYYYIDHGYGDYGKEFKVHSVPTNTNKINYGYLWGNVEYLWGKL